MGGTERTPRKLNERASPAGKWLGLSAAVPERHTAAVVADRFDRITWRDTCEQSAGLRDLAEELHTRYDHTTDLLTDMFLAAYKVRPRLRERAEMDPSRLVNHQVISSLVESPEFAELLPPGKRTGAVDAWVALSAARHGSAVTPDADVPRLQSRRRSTASASPPSRAGPQRSAGVAAACDRPNAPRPSAQADRGRVA